MKTKKLSSLLLAFLTLFLALSACRVFASTPAPTHTPAIVRTPTRTPNPTPTPRPTRTPNLAATQRAEDLNAEAQSYFEKGYLTTAVGTFKEYEDFREEWAQLYWYQWWPLDKKVGDFYLSAHFKWSSAYQNADVSGCGFVFGLQDNNDHYAVFLDRTQVLFLIGGESDTRELGVFRGTGRVKFGNPAESDFTLIVKGDSAYALVGSELVGEYALSKSRLSRGNLALTLLSGTNKDYGTRCEMTNIHLWTPK